MKAPVFVCLFFSDFFFFSFFLSILCEYNRCSDYTYQNCLQTFLLRLQPKATNLTGADPE